MQFSLSKRLGLSLLFVVFYLTSAFAAKFDVKVDAAQSWGALPHFWSCFGTCHYGIFLSHPEIQDHLKDAVKNLGMNKIRSHGILADDLGIYKEVNNQVVYTWTKADSVMDFLLSIGIRPVMEFGSMPRDLASDPKAESFPGGWVQIKSPPKDYAKWGNLIKEFVSHYKTKYGAEEIEKWRFEVWNEPELGGFWSGTEAQYLELYKSSVNAAKAAHPKIKIGGPSPSGPWQFGRVVNLLNYCKNNNLPIECIFYHTWIIKDARAGHFSIDSIIRKYDPNLESIDTEWGPTYDFHRPWQPQENTQGAVCAADVICSIARRCHLEKVNFPWAYSWWVVSDVFEEAGWNMYRNTPMNTGNMGLISRQGLHKPAYNVFKMLNMMGTTQISINTTPGGTVNGMATINADSSVHVMLYNSPKDYAYDESSERPPAGSDDVSIAINGIPFTTVNYRCMVVDGEHSNAYAAWLDMGKPDSAHTTAANWQTLRTTMVLDTVDSANGLQITNKTFTKSLTLRKEGVMLISLTPPPGTPVRKQVAVTPQIVVPAISAACINGTIQLSAAADKTYGIELIAPNGRVMLNRQGVQGNCSIPTSGMGPGVYVVRVTTAAGSSVLRQVIIPQR
jgi:xylan 1,4-beta-xylosidase